MLSFQDCEASAGIAAGTFVALHGHGADLDQLVPLYREAASALHAVMPQALRPTVPHTAGEMAASGGYSWYFIQRVGYPEPATFGESLWQVEQFLRDVRARGRIQGPLFLVGYEQGAVLAVTMTGIAPDWIAGVAAIGGYLPNIGGWSAPVQKAAGLPVLLINDPDDPEVPRALVEQTVAELVRRGAAVVSQPVSRSSQDPLTSATVLRDWLGARLTREPTQL